MTDVFSRRPILRVINALVVDATTAPRHARCPTFKIVEFGSKTNRTPINPIIMAHQRYKPTVSPRIGIDSVVISMGVRNRTAYVCASGSNENAKNAQKPVSEIARTRISINEG